MYFPTIKQSVILILLGLIFSSCVSRKELVYIQELDEKDLAEQYVNVRTEKKIQVYDKLHIKVYNIDPDVSSLFQERNSNTQNINLISYTVNEQGNIDFPFVGNVKLQGLTLDQAKVKLEVEFNKFIPNTSITVRFVGNSIVVLGEVNQQGEYPFFDDKINIFQALSSAGGINDYGDKSSVRIIREIDNEISFYEIDLSKKNIVESEFYYLIPNDIVIVDPINAKYRTYRDFALISMVLSAVSTLILVLNFL